MLKDDYKTSLTLLGRLNDRYDSSAWEDFVETYRKYIFVIIVKMGVKTLDAEDLTQQVLLKLWEKLPEFCYESNKRFRSYVATVTKNKVNDFYRCLNIEHRHMNQLSAALRENEVKLDASELDDLVEKEWELFILNRALDRVEPDFSGQAMNAFKLSLEGLDSAQIAERLNLKPDSVTKLNRRVKSKMIEQIKQLKIELE